MSYRSIKRVLGETNLERKCRILFGVCLLLLISGAFWWVDRIAENLVLEATRSKGRDLVDIALLKVHFDVFKKEDQRFAEFAKVIGTELKAENYNHKIVTLNPEIVVREIPAEGPEDEVERQILIDLQRRLRQQEHGDEVGPPDQAARTPAEEGGAGTEPSASAPSGLLGPSLLSSEDDNRPFADRILAQRNEYHYYYPIHWRARTCGICHTTLVETGALSAAETTADYGGQLPMHVFKLIIPYEATRAAINQTRAILIAGAILTVFVAMVGLYVIVRYVIVKPLKHLRDVSDEISKGNTELRAELSTGDEFEELANSFNRMLRHLIDAQSELRQVNKDLDAKVDQLAQLNLQLHEMNQLKSEFLANMSHELRTPLNSIIGFSEVLQGIDALNSRQKRYAENIQKSGRVLLEMINDILDLAKMEAGKMEVRPTEFDIATVVQAHCDMVRALSEEKNIDLEVHVPADAKPMFQDQAKVQRILTNLLSNAIKFTPEGGRITVSARRDEQERLELTVADTGVGIAEEDQEIIFEKFRQGVALSGEDRMAREYSGTGLGLSIVKELCRLLGGEITLESELGKGSTFKVVLPWICHPAPARTDEIRSRLDALAHSPRLDRAESPERPQPAESPAVSTAEGTSSK